ncbi:MAG: hypothetical protein GX193_11315 [Clostridiales bacterium]|nr:hypothetical protein [Clostridiales bacterium]
MIRNFEDFCRELLNAGFSLGSGGNDEGVFTLIKFGWDELPPPDCKIRWHTGDADTDPWEWRMRVLEERNDIAYGKVFFRKAGYITKEWYPYFLAARRENRSFDEMYGDGLISNYAKRVYDVIREHGSLPIHIIKQLCGFAKEDKSRFDRAIVDLQMGLFITMCGRQHKLSNFGIEYGWASTMFCTVEHFWGSEVTAAAAEISKEEAEEAITGQIYKLNSNADPKRVKAFIFGR